jgi:leukotriene-A4 hydrolase
MLRADPHSYTHLEQGQISHITFQISVDFKKQLLDVIASYKFEDPLVGSLYLDMRDLEIFRVHSKSEELIWEIDLSDPILGERLHLKELSEISEFTIELSTSTTASALQWVPPVQTKGGKYPFLYSQCFAIHARSLFPCQDTPAVRFTYDAQIEGPDPLTAVMAAASDGWEAVGKVRTYHFHMPQPIPSYLFAFAVGDLAFQDLSERCGIYAEPEMLQAAVWEFEENEKRLSAIEELYGPYIWDRYDVLIMPPSFPYGAMENPRLTFFSPVYVVGDRSGTWVVTHEMAHAWTGNLVTNATWEDFWLNEGWTTYAESRITEILETLDYSQLLGFVGQNQMKEVMERLGEDSERTSLKFDQKGIDPDETVTIIPYRKGCAFLVQLEQAVGREIFDEFIRKYLRKYQFKSLSTEEFVDFVLHELPQTQHLVPFEEWLYQPGFPDSAYPLQSKLHEQVLELVSSYKKGVLPKEEQISEWIFHQVFLFFLELPEKIPAEDCQFFEELFELQGSPRYAFLYSYYSLCIRSGYRAVLPEVEHFLGTIGISSRLVVVYRALAETEWTRDLARPYFEQYQTYYHSITVANIERALTESGV